MLQHTGHSVAETQALLEVTEIPGRFIVLSPDLTEERSMPTQENLVAAIGLTGIAGETREHTPTLDHEIIPVTQRTRDHLLATHHDIFSRFSETDNLEFVDLLRSANAVYSKDPNEKVLGGTLLENVDGEIREGIFVSKIWLPKLRNAVVNVSLAHYGHYNYGRPSWAENMAKKLPRSYAKPHEVRMAALRSGLTMMAHTFERVELPATAVAVAAEDTTPARHLRAVPDLGVQAA